ncbi:MAG: hypothetical protein ACRDHX_05025, partial [Chloroflexota bacterium]
DPDRADLTPPWTGSLFLSGFTPDSGVAYRFTGTRVWCGKPPQVVGAGQYLLRDIPNVTAQQIPTRFNESGNYTFDFMLDHMMFGQFTYCFSDSSGKDACAKLVHRRLSS